MFENCPKLDKEKHKWFGTVDGQRISSAGMILGIKSNTFVNAEFPFHVNPNLHGQLRLTVVSSISFGPKKKYPCLPGLHDCLFTCLHERSPLVVLMPLTLIKVIYEEGLPNI
jgi:hypothetical protein